MKQIASRSLESGPKAGARWGGSAWLACVVVPASSAQASMFHGETLDAIAEVLSWIVLFVAPIVAIAVFLVIHILPEKIAERRRHPQASAIKCLCLLSLFFGGLLWPLAWLWACSKPVLHKIAYGTDVGEEHGHTAVKEGEKEAAALRARIAELERRLAAGGGPAGGSA